MEPHHRLEALTSEARGARGRYSSLLFWFGRSCASEPVRLLTSASPEVAAMAGPEGKYCVGEAVEYFSRSNKQWIRTTVLELHAAKGFRIDCKKNQWFADWGKLRPERGSREPPALPVPSGEPNACGTEHAPAAPGARDRERHVYADSGLVGHAEKFLKSFGGVAGVMEKLNDSAETSEDTAGALKLQ